MLLLWASTTPPHPPPREPMPPPPRPPTRRAAANLGPVKEEKKAIPAAAMSYKAWDLSDNEAAPAMSLGHPAQQNAALLVLHQFQEDQHCKKKEKEKENNATVAVMVKYLVCCFRRSTKHYYIVLEFAAGTGNVRQGQIPPDLALIEVIIRVLAVQHAGSARWQDVQTKPSFLFSLLYNVLLSLYEIEGPYKSVILDCHYGLLLV